MKFGNKSSYFNLFMATFSSNICFVSCDMTLNLDLMFFSHGISCPLLISAQFCEVEGLCAQVEGIPDDPWFVKFAEAIKLWEICRGNKIVRNFRTSLKLPMHSQSWGAAGWSVSGNPILIEDNLLVFISLFSSKDDDADHFLSLV